MRTTKSLRSIFVCLHRIIMCIFFAFQLFFAASFLFSQKFVVCVDIPWASSHIPTTAFIVPLIHSIGLWYPSSTYAVKTFQLFFFLTFRNHDQEVNGRSSEPCHSSLFCHYPFNFKNSCNWIKLCFILHSPNVRNSINEKRNCHHDLPNRDDNDHVCRCTEINKRIWSEK
jgi:hypothetical protein